MLRIAVFVILVVMACDIIGEDFRCFPNRTIQFTNPNTNSFTYYRASYYDAATSNNANCTHMTSDNGSTVIFTCGDTSNNITAYFSDRSLSDDNIIGGAGVKYTFQCATLNDYNITLLGNLTAVSVNHTVESSTPFFDITANFFFGGVAVTTATLGQALTFTITGPSNYTMKPLLCVVKGGSNTKTLITDGCSHAVSLVSDFTIDRSADHEVDYNMTFHAFKFISTDAEDEVSDFTIDASAAQEVDDEMPFYASQFFDINAVELQCIVKICITTGCDFDCSSRQRRRSLSGKDADDDGARITSFRKILIIEDVVLGGTNRANGSLSLTLALSMLFALKQA